MNNAKNLKITSFLLAILFLFFSIVAYRFNNSATASAETNQEVIYYDTTYGASVGSTTQADYEVYYDSYEVTESVYHSSVPSYGVSGSQYDNYCGPLTGMNIVVYYDRWQSNLIPNFEPGISFSENYQYFLYINNTETRAAFDSIYNKMKTGEIGGTTSENFRNGLMDYVNDAGYSVSYSSFFSTATTVNLNTLKNAIDNNQVAVIMCSEYNYIYTINIYSDEGRIKVIKDNSTIPHMMMVYGYMTYKYYKDSVNFRTDTFLCVTNSKGDSNVGYMLLNDFSVIDEAYIVSIS